MFRGCPWRLNAANGRFWSLVTFLVYLAFSISESRSLVLGWGNRMISNAGMTDPSTAVRLGYLNVEVNFSVSSGPLAYPNNLFYIDAEGEFWESVVNSNLQMDDWNTELSSSPMAFAPSAVNFSKPLVSVVGTTSRIGLDNDGNLYFWGSNILNSGQVLPPTLMADLELDSLMSDFHAPYANDSKFTHLSSQGTQDPSYSAHVMIGESGFAYAMSNDMCTTGQSHPMGPGTPALPVEINYPVTLIDARYKHGVAVSKSVAGVTHLWAWGQGRFTGKDLTSPVDQERCYLPSLVPLPLATSEGIIAVLAAPLGTYVLTSSGILFYFDHLSPREDVQLTSLGQASNRISTMISTASSAHFLFQNGDVWTRVHTPNVGYSASTALSTFASELPFQTTGLFKADFGLALPSNYFITNILGSYHEDAVYAIAKSRDQAAPELPISLPRPSNPNSKKLVYWGECAINSNTRLYLENLGTSIPMIMPTEIELRHLEANNVANDDIVRWRFDGLNALVQTTNHLLAFGIYRSLEGAGLSPWSSYTTWALPKILDPWLYDYNLGRIQDIASSNSTHLILCTNGTIIQWGMENMDDFVGKRSDPSTGSKRSSQAFEHPHLGSVASLSRFEGPFVRLTAKLGGIGAIDVNGSIYTWGGQLSPEGPGGPPFNHFHATLELYSGARILSMTNNGFLAKMTYSPSTEASLLLMNALEDPLNFYDCNNTWRHPDYSQYAYCELPPNEDFNVTDVQEIVGGSTWYVVRTAFGAWYMGLVPFFKTDAVRNLVPVPLPSIFGSSGIGWSSVMQLAFTDQNIYWHLHNGTVWASCGDWATFCLKGQSTSPIFQDLGYRRILDGWNTTLISSIAGNCQMALVEEARDLNVPFLTRYFGESFTGASGHGLTKQEGAPESGTLLPAGHPMESETANSFEIGSHGILRDGSFSNSNNPRYLVWGDAKSISDSYSAIPGPLNLNPWIHIDPEEIVKIIAPRAEIIIAFRNCSLIVLSNDNYIVPTSPPAFLDRDYQFSTRRFRVYLRNTTFFENADCRDDASTLSDISQSRMDIQCVPIHPKSSITCTILAPSGNYFFLYHRRDQSNVPLACDTGFYGPISVCNAASGNTMQFRIEISSQLSGRSVAQYAVGLLHGLVLLDDGSLVSWGSNSHGQLGVTGVSSSATFQPVSIPSAFSGESITLVAASKMNSYVLIGGRYVLSWGSNWHGGLGNAAPEIPFASIPTPVQAPVRPILQFVCGAHTCYILYANGEVYSWGHNAMKLLGRDLPPNSPKKTANLQPFSATPALATLFTFPGPPARRISQIIARTSSMAVFVRAGIYTEQAEPTEKSCQGSPPSPQFNCVDGTWIIVNNVVVGGSNATTPTLVITGPTVVIGDVTVSPGSIIVISNPSPSTGKPLLNVTGCFSSSSTEVFEIMLDPQTFKTQIPTLGGTELTLVESSCAMATGLITVSAPKDCKKVTATTKSKEKENGRHSLISVFKVDKKSCSVWWIILVSVLGAVLVGCAVAVIAWKLWRRKIFVPIPSKNADS